MEIPVINWFDEPIKSSIAAVFKGLNNGTEAIDIFNKYRSTHFSQLKEVVGKMKVLGMTNSMPLRDLYYPTTVSSAIKRRLYAPEWHSIESAKIDSALDKSKSKKIDGAEQFEKSDRLVVLGGPGAGKTTFLKFLALAYSDKEIFEDSKLRTSKLPFYISLPELSRSNLTLLEYICRPLISKEGEHAKYFIERSIKKGLSVVLLDSLDEVPVNRPGFCRHSSAV